MSIAEGAPQSTRHQQLTPPITQIGAGIYAHPRTRRWRKWSRLLPVSLVLAVAVLSTQLIAAYSAADDRLVVHLQSEQPIYVDLGMGIPRSPYAYGVNVFPEEHTQSTDGAYGFMSYDTRTLGGLAGAGITMLRFPGGSWGEAHTPSYDQINAFLGLAAQTHTTSLIQVRLSGGSPQQAAALVSYCNNPHNPLRQQYPNAPFVPVHYWVIGNEPDLIGPGYTVADYVRDYIAFATAMKAVDPVIQILGPEISHYNGPNSSPRDATGTPWLEGFLRGIAAFEHTSGERILDGVTVHSYPFVHGMVADSLLWASGGAWRYGLPSLRAQVHQIMGENLPIGITEINTSPLGDATASPYSTAMWWADTLGTLLEGGVTYVDYFAARGLDHPYSLLAADGTATPVSRVMQLYAHLPANIIPVDSGNGLVSLYAATDAARDTLALLLVNKSAAQTAIRIVPERIFSSWHTRQIELPPYAIACVILRRSGNAGDQALVYAPSAQTLATSEAGAITITPLH